MPLLSDPKDSLELQNAMYRQRLRQALGIAEPQESMDFDPQTVEMMLKRKRLSSILKNQMQEAGLGELAAATRFRGGSGQ